MGWANGAVIATQTFESDQHFNGGGRVCSEGISRKSAVTYKGAGLAFEANGWTNTQGPDANRFTKTEGGTLQFGHQSSAIRLFEANGTGKYTYPKTIKFDHLRAGFVSFSPVDLSGYVSKTLSIDLIGNASNDSDDMLFIRLFLNGSTKGTDVLITSGDNVVSSLTKNAKFDGGTNTFTYTFDDSVTSAELFMGVSVDGDGSSLAFDNVVFSGVVAQPTDSVVVTSSAPSSALISIGGVALHLSPCE